MIAAAPIALRRPDPDPDSADSRRLWEWRMDPVTRKMSRSAAAIPWEAHRAWYARALGDPRKRILIAAQGDVDICMVRFDDIDQSRAEVSINMNPAMRGKGQGRAVLRAACDYAFSQLNINILYAEIKPENTASIKIFEGAGFVFQKEKDGLRGYLLMRPGAAVTAA